MTLQARLHDHIFLVLQSALLTTIYSQPEQKLYSRLFASICGSD